ncbi:glycoside hydrolase family 5 protein [Pseudomonas sp. MM211]|uniref:glycoside hydrolase family 5 protein n=1 Tax=Pseudomonas sp. MM211 TaxID=2866808 RepID=UPI001CECA42B|nr:cellulase family glycosylhydrolase [Pseudomonas sp. MM211]UCJ18283.1 glycoside hydrolase family 5 protein [Pseudomonas sp. MM211]
MSIKTFDQMAAAGEFPLIGFNVAGLGNNPYVDAITTASLDTHYRTIAPRGHQPDYIKSYAGGLNGKPFAARLPFAGERIAILDGAGGFTLRQGYIEEIRKAIRHVHSWGGYSLLDMHNYARWYVRASGPVAGRTVQSWGGGYALWTSIGASDCPVDYPLLARIWAAIVQTFKDEPGVLGYGLMNEPHNAGTQADGGVNVEALWSANVQRLINAVRAEDSRHFITVAGNAFSTALHWPARSDALKNLTDPAGRLLYEAHQYPDKDGVGGGKWTAASESISYRDRVADWRPYVDWLKANGKRGIAGEFGGPDHVPGMRTYFTELHKYFDANHILRFQWLAGPGDADDAPNGMDRNDGTLKPNTRSLMARIGNTTTAYGPR